MDAENRSKSFVLGEYFADVPLRQEGHRRAVGPQALALHVGGPGGPGELVHQVGVVLHHLQFHPT